MKKWIIMGSFLVMGLLGFAYVNGIYNTGVEYEERLSAQYESNQNELSQFVTSFYEQVGVADLKTEQMDTILSHAVQGRYGEDGFSADGAFFSAVMEAYPDLSGLDIYDNIQLHVSAGRESFKNDQDRLLDQLRSFNAWRRSGLVRRNIVSVMFPSDNLEARVGGAVVAEGEAALAQMRQLVLENTSVEAFQTGRMEPLSPR